jgi:hypothetical protein
MQYSTHSSLLQSHRSKIEGKAESPDRITRLRASCFGQSNEHEQEATMATVTETKHQTFSDFYPFYLSEHSNRTCRRLHFTGSTLALFCLGALFVTGSFWWLLVGLFCGYGFAWLGHFGFEKNRPASFKQPLYSFMGDWVMYWQMLTGRISF